MGEREALLRAVCENPDDDLPRLVYADWLDEHGDPEQAEFIRVGIELGRQPGYPDGFGPEHRELYRRMQAYPNQRDWKRELTFRGSVKAWARGFVFIVEYEAEAWRTSAKDVLRLHPVRAIGFSDIEDGASLELVHQPGHSHPWRLMFTRVLGEERYVNEQGFQNRDELVAACAELLSTWLQDSGTYFHNT